MYKEEIQPRCFTVVDHDSKSFLQSSNSVSLFQSNYALGHQQDTDFSTPYSARARMYDLPSSNTFGVHHQMSSSSTSSLSGIGLGGPSTSSGFNHHHQQIQNQLPPSSNALTNLIVNYLPQDCNERELHSMFSPMGPVDTCRVVRDFKVSFMFLLFLSFHHQCKN
jgi:hypothetical protein